MTTPDLLKTADALDLLGAHLDATEGESLRKQAAATQDKIATLAERYEAQTGEKITPELREKLAGLGDDGLAELLKIARTESSAVLETLGGADDDSQDTKTASEDHPRQAAAQRFANWIMS